MHLVSPLGILICLISLWVFLNLLGYNFEVSNPYGLSFGAWLFAPLVNLLGSGCLSPWLVVWSLEIVFWDFLNFVPCSWLSGFGVLPSLVCFVWFAS